MKKLFSILLAVMLALGTVACGGASGNSRREKLYDFSLRIANEKGTAAVVIEFIDKAVHLDPTNEDYYILLSKAYDENGEYLKATEVLKLGIKKTNGETVKQKLVEYSQTKGNFHNLLEFDSNYNLVKHTDLSNKRKDYEKYEYDDNNQLIKMYRVSYGGEHYSDVEYDENGNITITEIYKDELNLVKKYDSFWSEYLYETYSSKGGVHISSATYKDFDEKHNMIKETIIYDSGKYVDIDEYDECGFPIKHYMYHNDMETPYRTDEYTYDKNYNLIKVVETYDEEIKTFINVYDESNRCIKQEKYIGVDMELEYCKEFDYTANDEVERYIGTLIY